MWIPHHVPGWVLRLIAGGDRGCGAIWQRSCMMGMPALLLQLGLGGLSPASAGAGRRAPIKAGLSSQIEVEEKEDVYQVHLGQWRLRVAKEPFRMRLLILFLRQLEEPMERRNSRATHDGRRPLVRQQQLPAWFKVPQPNIGRWEQYWLAGEWAKLSPMCNGCPTRIQKNPI